MSSNLEYSIMAANEFCAQVTDGTHDSPKKQSSGKYLITSRHLKEFYLDFDNAYFITQDDYIKINERSKVETWDILISMIGTVGSIYLEKSKHIEYAIKNVGLFKLGGDISKAKWLYYYLKTPKAYEYIKMNMRGSTQQYIPLGALRKLPIKCPKSKREMNQITKILSTLDEKIEVNNQINKTLENMAQAIFKRWFVDFEFPNEDGEPYKSSGGEMVESELGMIPKGWEVKKLGDLVDVQKGLSYKGKHLVDRGIPMLNLGTIQPGGGFRPDKMKFYDGDYKDRHTVKTGDIVIANTDMTQDRIILGSPCIVPEFHSSTIIFTHHLFAFRNIKLPRNYLYYYLKSNAFRERAESYATGTTVLALPKNGVVDIDVCLPSSSIVNKFDEISSSLLDKVENNNKEILELVIIRDSLIPKLMSGEIRVPLEQEDDVL